MSVPLGTGSPTPTAGSLAAMGLSIRPGWEFSNSFSKDSTLSRPSGTRLGSIAVHLDFPIVILGFDSVRVSLAFLQFEMTFRATLLMVVGGGSNSGYRVTGSLSGSAGFVRRLRTTCPSAFASSVAGSALRRSRMLSCHAGRAAWASRCGGSQLNRGSSIAPGSRLRGSVARSRPPVERCPDTQSRTGSGIGSSCGRTGAAF